MGSPTLSIIVPVYKVEPYLKECIDSILQQTYTDFELILVNDGSPDSCGAICDAATKSDNRIRVIHQKNQGVTRARANGAAAARGEYVSFVDGDDTIPPHALKTLVAYADSRTDIVLGNIQDKHSPCPPIGEVPLDSYRQMCVCMKGIHTGPCAKLFRRSLFNEWVFDIPRELRVGEDAIMNIRLAYRATGKIFSTGAVIYEYRTNNESVTNTIRISPEMDMLMGKYRLVSFPQADLQMHVKAGLYESLIVHWLNALHHTPTLPPSVRKYRQFLLSIQKESGYRFNLYSYLLFHCSGPIFLRLLTATRKLFQLIKPKRR